MALLLLRGVAAPPNRIKQGKVTQQETDESKTAVNG
jgi:hypothetical protein